MKNEMNRCVMLLINFVIAGHVGTAATYYVSTNGNDGNAGTSWATAKQTIQAGVNAANAGDIVWVTNGTYATGGAITPGKTLFNRVVITNAITVRSVNGPATTFIVGEGPKGTNAVRGAFLCNDAQLIGFTVTNGHTTLDGPLAGYNTYGAGITIGLYAPGAIGVLVSNCVIEGNNGEYAGGVYNDASGRVVNCLIKGNSCDESGAGIRMSSPNAYVENCKIVNNTAGYRGGGVKIYHYGQVINCLIADNSAANSSGGAYIDWGSYGAYIESCTIANNQAPTSGGLGYIINGATVVNTIIYGNSNGNWSSGSYTYCCLTPLASGTGNITNNPQFTDANYHVNEASPTINAGTNQNWMTNAVDLDGNPRVVGGRVDMGVYEYTGLPSVPTSVSASDGTYTDRIRVTWNAASSATGYRIFRYTSNNSASADQIGTATSTTYDDTGAAAGTTYYYWIKATNAAGASAFSDSDVGYLDSVATPLDAPTGLSASDGTYTDRIRISWNAVSGALGYQFFRNTSDSSNGLSVYATTTDTTYNDTAVSLGVNYYYWVKATNASLSSAFSASDVGYLGSSVVTLDAPTGLSASDGTYSNLVRLTWNAVSGALYYELWRNTSNNSASASVLAQTTNSVTYDDTAVSVGVTYYYWAKAKNAQTTSAFSHPESGYASYVPATPAGNADLSLMTFLFLPATLTTNQHPGAVSVQLINYGPMNLTSPDTRVAIDFYLSANSTFGDEDDISIGDYTSDQILGASTYTTIVVPASGRMGLMVPPTVTAGTYYVFASVRHTYPSSLTDPDESNNYVIREGAVTVTVESEGGGTDTGYHLINDYDGDGKSDLALYQETTGEWLILLSGSGYQTATAVLGGQGYRPALADYDGDGKSDLAVYHQASGQWLFMLSSENYAISTLTMGGPGYVPVPADYDGDGLADPIVYHESSGLWQIQQSATNYEAISVSLGGNGYKAVAADFDGDGKADIAVFRRSTGDWKIMLSSLQYWTVEFQFGGSGFVPVPADYDADGLTDPAVYKDSTGEWRVMLSKYSYLTATATFGGNGFVAVPADYDGDGKGDVVVYSENAGELRILLSGSGYAQTVVTVGGPGYEPVGYYDW